MIKRGGAPLAPRELEEAAQTVPAVRVAAAVGVPRELTEEIVIVVETDPAAQDIERLVATAVERALGFAPDRVVVVEPRTIPRTRNGKIQHAVLRRLLL
jgi:acyl-CoA synthetase (AMP-forming)/AMP-acid ligase II